jgi:thiol-disulfide isomerase/thioredoxin
VFKESETRAMNHRAYLTATLSAALLVSPLSPQLTATPLSAAAAGRSGATAKLTSVDAAGIRRRLAALRGKIVVLNLWATWCGPCVMEFPELVRFEKAYRGRGVSVIGLSMDEPDKALTLVPAFLRKQNAAFPVYIMKRVDPPTVIAVFDKFWEGAIPMTYVFDRKGQLQTRLNGARTLYEFERAVKPLLK